MAKTSQVCRCNAYTFPHREGGGSCPMEDGRDPNDDGDCHACVGTGIGWGGPDSACGVCGGSGVKRERFTPGYDDDYGY